MRLLPYCRFWKPAALLLVASIIVSTASADARASDPLTGVTCDLQVLYITDHPARIDWPTLFMLHDRQGCSVDIISLHPARTVLISSTEADNRAIRYWDISLPTRSAVALDSVAMTLFAARRPDIVLLAPLYENDLLAAARDYLTNLPADSASLFNIARIYANVSPEETADRSTAVVNTHVLWQQYFDDIKLTVAQLGGANEMPTDMAGKLTHYAPVFTASGTSWNSPGILGDLPTLRLDTMINLLIGPSEDAIDLSRRARSFRSHFNSAIERSGSTRMDNVIQGYKELVQLQYLSRDHAVLGSHDEYSAYFDRLVARARQAVLDEVGVEWEGTILLRESPHGPKVKFNARVSVRGPVDVELSYVRFYPYWTDEAVPLDSVSRKIAPRQSFVREYMVDIDPKYLETDRGDSLVFGAEIVFGRVPLTVSSAVPVRAAAPLSVEFLPNFHFVSPSARLNVDKLVQSMNWKVAVRKPVSYAGPVRLNLETPVGVFAGAYRQELRLEAGRASEVVTIPFSVSNLFEMGIHTQKVSLLVDGKPVSTDTGLIRVAAFEVTEERQVAILPDSSGRLEDILRIAGVGYQVLSDRGLWTADLAAYDVILIGSGAFRNYPSLGEIKGRLEDFIRYGGSLVILGQPASWPKNALPVLFATGSEHLARSDVSIRLPHANTLSRPYKIDVPELLTGLQGPRSLNSAVITPSEVVLSTPSGAGLLSVSRRDEGQIIYCGLPLTDLVARLNLEAIHLLANLLNY